MDCEDCKICSVAINTDTEQGEKAQGFCDDQYDGCEKCPCGDCKKLEPDADCPKELL